MRWPNRTTKERFEEKVSVIPFSGCWLWTANVNAWGYGTFAISKDELHVLAHRASWRLYRGDIPQGALVLHKCDVPCCVNPEHLFLGDNKANVRDAVAKGRWPSKNVTYCKNGHEFTVENTIIRTNGRRACRECARFHWRNYAAERRREAKSTS